MAMKSTKKRVPTGRAGAVKEHETMNGREAWDGAMAMLRPMTMTGTRSGLPVVIIIEVADAVTEVDR